MAGMRIIMGILVMLFIAFWLYVVIVMTIAGFRGYKPPDGPPPVDDLPP